MSQAELEAQGFKVHVQLMNEQTAGDRWGTRHGEYVIWINADKPTAKVLKEKPGLPLVDVVAACWKNGVNPRVYMPTLPHGFEERHGISYSGGRYEVPKFVRATDMDGKLYQKKVM